MAARAQRDRAIQKIYNDFLEAATQGAIAMVKGSFESKRAKKVLSICL
jgi:hypothetical protein